jgi:ethanolamine ammonia-lyase small subunit
MQEDEAQALVEAMLEGNALELLVQRLASLDETQDAEAAAVYAALSIFENIIELKPEVSEQAVQKTKVWCGIKLLYIKPVYTLNRALTVARVCLSKDSQQSINRFCISKVG